MQDWDSMPFGSLTIWFDRKGFRPRPWTQMQSAWAADLLARLPPGDLLELCAGAGHIGLLALAEADRATGAQASSRRRLVQVDRDATACRLAVHNAASAGLGDRVEVRQGLVEQSLAAPERFVMIIADPPWVPSRRVRDYPENPQWAIDGGSDGLGVVRALLPVTERHLHATGVALLQVGGPHQVDRVQHLLQSTGSPLSVAESREAPDVHNGAVALLEQLREPTQGDSTA